MHFILKRKDSKLCCPNYCSAFYTKEKKWLELHDSLKVSDHNLLIEKETELMIETLIDDFDLKSWGQLKLITLNSKCKVNICE